MSEPITYPITFAGAHTLVLKMRNFLKDSTCTRCRRIHDGLVKLDGLLDDIEERQAVQTEPQTESEPKGPTTPTN